MADNIGITTRLAISVFLTALGTTIAAGRTIYVDANAAGANDGSSWSNAYNYLQDALTDANSSEKPVEIRVAQGVYTPDSNSAAPDGTGNREATFRLINGVTLEGGYAGFGEHNPDARDINAYETILSGDPNGDDGSGGDNTENIYHVVTGHNVDETAVLDGLTVTGGNANGPGSNGRGGGMYNSQNSSPTLTNCMFSDNSAAQAGGMFNLDFGNPTLTNCTFLNNLATQNGGAMLNWNSSPIVTNCTFKYNSSGGDGAGIYNYFEQTAPLIANCIFSGNYAEGDGGGMYNRNSTHVTIVNCMFTGNSSPNGNAVACDSHGGGHLYPNTVKLTNCILWEGGNEIWIRDDSTVEITFSDIRGGWPGEGNIEVDPLLTPDGHLRGDSPCINAGDPAYSPAPWAPTSSSTATVTDCRTGGSRTTSKTQPPGIPRPTLTEMTLITWMNTVRVVIPCSARGTTM